MVDLVELGAFLGKGEGSFEGENGEALMDILLLQELGCVQTGDIGQLNCPVEVPVLDFPVHFKETLYYEDSVRVYWQLVQVLVHHLLV